MANRSRNRFVRYGGEQCGVQSNIGPMFTPAKLGKRNCTDETHSGPPYRTGGPLLIEKVKYDIQRFPHFSVAQGPVSFSGYLSATTYTPSSPPAKTNLAGWGAKGWNLTVPTRPIYQAGVSLVELRDASRALKTTMESMRALSTAGVRFSKSFTSVGDFLHNAKKGAKYVADNYLNTQFGWAPMVQDMEFFLNYQLALSKKLNWLRKQNGKSVRRQIELNRDSWSQGVGVFTNRPGTLSPFIDTGFYADSSFPFIMTVDQEYKGRIWFSAKYRFWLPKIPKAASKAPLGLKLKLMGLGLDPSILYKAYRWTWLLDWFTSVGAVLQNLFHFAQFSVVAEYAYVMCDESHQFTAHAECNMNTGTYSFVTGTFPGKLYLRGRSLTSYEFKQRVAASPFGFGITWAGLTPFQLSILVSLGISTRLR